MSAIGKQLQGINFQLCAGILCPAIVGTLIVRSSSSRASLSSVEIWRVRSSQGLQDTVAAMSKKAPTVMIV